MTRLIQILSGHTIAIVGNGNVVEDFSQEIDSHDIVIRFNHFYNYDSNLVGKRVDIILQTFTNAWHNAENKHLDVIKSQKPQIFVVKRPDLYNSKVNKIFDNCVRIDNTGDLFKDNYKYTTGTCALIYLAKNLKNAKVKCYGFQDDNDWERYISTDAKKYAYNKEDERNVMLNSINMLEALKIREQPMEIPKVILIPIKANSQGAPNKNEILIRHCINECLKCKLPLHIVGDDVKLLRDLKKEYNGKIKTLELPTIEPLADVSETIRKWVAETGYCGNLALVQCTSPSLSYTWILDCFKGLEKAPLSATACEIDFKPTALFRKENNVFVPYNKAMPPASTARQILPKTIRITGAVEAFHTDCLRHYSFWSVDYIAPVMIDAKYSLDVDTIEDLERAKSLIQ